MANPLNPVVTCPLTAAAGGVNVVGFVVDTDPNADAPVPALLPKPLVDVPNPPVEDVPNAGDATVDPTFPNPPNVCEPNELVTAGTLFHPLFAASNAAF